MANADSYWYSVLSSPTTCYATTATHLRIYATGLRTSTSSLRVMLQYSTSGVSDCNKLGRSIVTITNTNWVLDGATGFDVAEIPLTSFTGAILNKIYGITFAALILPANVEVTFRSISFAFGPLNTVVPSPTLPPVSSTVAISSSSSRLPTSSVPSSTLVPTSTSSSVPTPILITDFRSLAVNQFGFDQSDDRTLVSYRKVYATNISQALEPERSLWLTLIVTGIQSYHLQLRVMQLPLLIYVFMPLECVLMQEVYG